MNAYAINAYVAWCYEWQQQQLNAYNAWYYEQLMQERQRLLAIVEADRLESLEQIQCQEIISRRYFELHAAEAEAIRIKEQYHIEVCHRQQQEEEHAEFKAEFDAILKEADEARLAYSKEVYMNEKAQELAQCRVYREEDKFERLLNWQQKRSEKRRMWRKQSRKQRAANKVTAAEEQSQIKNYPQEVYEKAQSDISLGKGQIHGERGRYSIPRTKRPMGSSFGWAKNTSRN